VNCARFSKNAFSSWHNSFDTLTEASHTISGFISGSCASYQISSASEPGAMDSSFCSLRMKPGMTLTQLGTM
jgi:hypothetical protein